ncbi:MAG: hypothetical protein FH753_04905 [Firmicutes bacterium]|nr:hypothetical protein [Bacillota bacterium]
MSSGDNDVKINEGNNNSKKDKKVEEVLEKMKDKFNPSDEQYEKFKEMAKKYSDKSEDDIFVEIINLNKKLIEDGNKEDFMNKLKKLEKLRPMLNEEQVKKLDKILKILKENE